MWMKVKVWLYRRGLGIGPFYSPSAAMIWCKGSIRHPGEAVWDLRGFDKYMESIREIINVCAYCGKSIIWMETPIDDFWTHFAGIGRCEGMDTWAWPEGVEEPPPLKLTIKEVTNFDGELGKP